MTVTFRRRRSLSRGGRHRRRDNVVSCQHCGVSAPTGRVMCPTCRRRLQPASADLAATAALAPPAEPSAAPEAAVAEPLPLWRRPIARAAAAGVALAAALA